MTSVAQDREGGRVAQGSSRGGREWLKSRIDVRSRIDCLGMAVVCEAWCLQGELDVW